MAEVLDSWLYDSINEATDTAELALSRTFQSPPGLRVIGSADKEEEFVSAVEQKVDKVVEEFSRRCSEIFEIKPDVHTVSIISLDIDRLRSIIREGLIAYSFRS